MAAERRQRDDWGRKPSKVPVEGVEKRAAFIRLTFLFASGLLLYAVSSPNYITETAVIDNGGERSTSASFVQQCSIGGPALGFGSSASYQSGTDPGYTVFEDPNVGGPVPAGLQGETVLGLGPASGNGYSEILQADAFGFANAAWIRVPWSAYNSQNGLSHPALGDLDGDGKEEIVVGLGPYPQNGGWLVIFEDGGAGYAVNQWIRIPFAAYNAINGMSWPTCGDVDGDGRDEVVVGLGPYPQNGGWVWVFDDLNAGCATLKWLRIPWAGYNGVSGEGRPACGDFDADGREEVLVGLGPNGGDGYLVLFEDAVAGWGVLRWLRVPWAAYNSANGETHPAAGELDGDGADEIAVGLGSVDPALGGGWWCCFDDGASGYAFESWERVPWSAYNATGKGTRPAVANVDADPEAETIVGLYPHPSSGGWVCLWGSWSEDALHGWVRVNWAAYNSLNGETWPAAGDSN